MTNDSVVALSPPLVRWALIAHCVLLVAAAAATGEQLQADDVAPPLPERTYLEAVHEGIPYSIELVHELVNDPDVSPVFNVPGHSAIGSDGRQYYVDSGDVTIHVLDEAGEHLANIGSEGQGPGELQAPRLVAAAPNGEIYVWDRTKRSVEVFDSSYAYLRSSALPFSLDARSMSALGANLLLFSGTTLAEQGFGFGIHVFSIGDGDATHVTSFADTVAIDPAYYDRFGFGFANLDLDRGILYNQMAPYSVRKYSLDGSLLWRIDDPILVPPPLASAEPDAAGRLRVGRYAISATVIPLGEGRYLHIILKPPEGAPEGTRVVYERIFELIETEGNQPVRRVQFPVKDPLVYTMRDGQGRLYGLWHEWDFLLIRSTITVKGGVS